METHTFLHKHLSLLRSIFSFYQKQPFWVNVYPPPFAWHLQQCREWLTMMESVQPRRRLLGNSVSKTLVKSAFILIPSIPISPSIISSFLFLRYLFINDIHNSKSLHSSIIFISLKNFRQQTLMTLSSWSTIPLEEVAAAAPGGYRWFQLYVYKVCHFNTLHTTR